MACLSNQTIPISTNIDINERIRTIGALTIEASEYDIHQKWKWQILRKKML